MLFNSSSLGRRIQPLWRLMTLWLPTTKSHWHWPPSIKAVTYGRSWLRKPEPRCMALTKIHSKGFRLPRKYFMNWLAKKLKLMISRQITSKWFRKRLNLRKLSFWGPNQMNFCHSLTTLSKWSWKDLDKSQFAKLGYQDGWLTSGLETGPNNLTNGLKKKEGS